MVVFCLNRNICLFFDENLHAVENMSTLLLIFFVNDDAVRTLAITFAPLCLVGGIVFLIFFLILKDVGGIVEHSYLDPNRAAGPDGRHRTQHKTMNASCRVNAVCAT